MKIVMVSAEANPFLKTGGLADVVYSLSKELVVMGHEVSIFMPFYRQIKNRVAPSTKLIKSFMVSLSYRKKLCDVYVTYADGITYYLLDNKDYFDRDSVYGDGDDGERFAFFNLASKELLFRLSMKPNIIHAHDWHTGMLACLIKEDKLAREILKNTKFVYSIHNPAFQGIADRDILPSCYNLSTDLYDNGQVRFMDKVSTLKAGIIYADKVTTVSPNHRFELLTIEGSMGLNGVLELRRDDFVGILNGIDYLEFNPLHDIHLSHNYSVVNFFREKELNKRVLFKYLGLVEYGKPTFAMVSRLTWQKGLDIMYDALDYLLANGCNVLILGTGENRYERMFLDLKNRYPKRMAVELTYNDDLAHQFYASSDFFLMPSLFEPCGLGQMIAQRYGTLPIVRNTGGLRDSVIGYNNENADFANGFSFDDFSKEALLGTVQYALKNWMNIPLRKKLMHNAMKLDNSWRKSAKEYYRLYSSLVKKKK